MSLNRRQRHQLHRIEARMLRSDPRLVEMLGVFGRLSAGQRMPSWEHVATRPDRTRQAAALIVEAITLMAAATRLLLVAVLALFSAVVLGGRARPPLRPSQQAHPSAGADGRPDPADWS
jgi:Protein of unknown function (DUF3040)